MARTLDVSHSQDAMVRNPNSVSRCTEVSSSKDHLRYFRCSLKASFIHSAGFLRVLVEEEADLFLLVARLDCQMRAPDTRSLLEIIIGCLSSDSLTSSRKKVGLKLVIFFFRLFFTFSWCSRCETIFTPSSMLTLPSPVKIT